VIDAKHIMERVRLVIFDCDGVMFDSKEANRAYYNHILAHQMSYFPFIRMMQMEPYLKAFLEYLRPAYKTAISTNRSDTMNRVLWEHGLEGYFDLVVSSLDVKRPKPHPESLLKILSHFGLCPQEAIYIGDSEIDELAAKAAGIPLVAYKNTKLSAPFGVEHFKEIEILLERKKG
jgi:phosphoglycolate phosphatase